MNTYIVLLILLALSVLNFTLGKKRVLAAVNGDMAGLHSLPNHYGWFAVIFSLTPSLFILFIWMVSHGHIIDTILIEKIKATYGALRDFEINVHLSDIRNLANNDAVSVAISPELREAADYYDKLRVNSFWAAALLAFGIMLGASAYIAKLITPTLRARNHIEQAVRFVLVASSTIAILTTIGIVLSLLFETMLFLQHVAIDDFLFGLKWSPQTALRADQVGSSGSFGALPLFAGTLFITFIALLVAGPIGLLSAIYMTEFASDRIRTIAKPVLEILAGVPTVVYGFFAALVVAPAIRDFGTYVGLDVASESALAAGLVMGIMIIPFISSLSDDAITAVPQSMRDGSLALGSTKTETMLKVLLPAALPGVVSAFLLATSRAVGETMIVVMAAGMAANLTANPLDAVTTVTVQIVALLTGDQEFDSAKTLSAFALGLALFIITLCLNVVALYVVRKYREEYE